MGLRTRYCAEARGGGPCDLFMLCRGLNTVLSVTIEVLTVQITQYVVDVYIHLRESIEGVLVCCFSFHRPSQLSAQVEV